MAMHFVSNELVIRWDSFNFVNVFSQSASVLNDIQLIYLVLSSWILAHHKHSHLQTHAHTLTHTRTLIHSDTHTHTCIHNSHTHERIHSDSLTRTPTYTLTHTHSHTHIFSHTSYLRAWLVLWIPISSLCNLVFAVVGKVFIHLNVTFVNPTGLVFWPS